MQAYLILEARTFLCQFKTLESQTLKFITVCVGAHGKQTDGGISKKVFFVWYVTNNTFRLPRPKELTGANINMPWVILMEHILF
jgi:hypothetical protein